VINKDLNNMTTVYVVTSGCYDDYSIDGVFSTKEKAEEFVKAPNFIYEYSYSIEEYKLDDLFNSKNYFTMKDVITYWECEVTTSSCSFGKKEGEYSVKEKVIAKKDIDNVKAYVRHSTCFICTSLISESDVAKKAYNYYQEYLNETGKYDAGFWKLVSNI
jgi:hypothetical protein